VVDRHPEMVVILAGINDVYLDWVLCVSPDDRGWSVNALE
jgi:hypothetical protein